MNKFTTFAIIFLISNFIFSQEIEKIIKVHKDKNTRLKRISVDANDNFVIITEELGNPIPFTCIYTYDKELNQLDKTYTDNFFRFQNYEFNSSINFNLSKYLFGYNFHSFHIKQIGGDKKEVEIEMSPKENIVYALENKSNLNILTKKVDNKKSDLNYNFDCYEFNGDLSLLDKQHFSIPKKKIKTDYSTVMSLNENFIQYNTSLTDVGRGNKEKPHKLKIDYIILSKNKEPKYINIIASEETYKKYKITTRGSIMFPNNERKEFYLVYPNKDASGYIFDVFDINGTLKETIKGTLIKKSKMMIQGIQSIELIEKDIVAFNFPMLMTKEKQYFILNLKNKTAKSKYIKKGVSSSTPLTIFYIRDTYPELYKEIKHLFEGGFLKSTVKYIIIGDKKYCVTDIKDEISIYKFSE